MRCQWDYHFAAFPEVNIYRRLNLLNKVFIVFNLMETSENGKKG